MGCENTSTSKNRADFPCISLQNQDGSSSKQSGLNLSKEQPSHTSPSAGSSLVAADQDAEVKTSAEETLAQMKEVRPRLSVIKAALTEAATSSNSADIKTHQNSINTEIFALDNMISSLTEHLLKQNWVVLGQQLDKYQELLQQAKDKVCDAQSALAAVKCNDAAKVSLGATATAIATSNLF